MKTFSEATFIPLTTPKNSAKVKLIMNAIWTIFPLLFLLVLATAASAQNCIIKDKDGYVNVHKGPSLKSMVIGRISAGQFFHKLDSGEFGRQATPGWSNVWFPTKRCLVHKHITKYNDTGEGYIHDSRIDFLTSLQQLEAATCSPQKVSFKTQGLEIVIETGKFNRKNHKITGTGSNTLVDNEFPNGISGPFPKEEITKMYLVTASGKYYFPRDAFSNFYEPHTEATDVFLGKKGEIYIVMSCSDGSQGYSVAWCIKQAKLYSVNLVQDIP